MGISPMYQFQLAPAWTPVVTLDGGVPCNLLGVDIASFVLIIKDMKKLSDKTGAGTFKYVNQSGGQIHYQWEAPDTDVIGTYQLWVSFIATSGKRQDCDPVDWRVKSR